MFRMYSRYAETRRWKVEIMSASEGEHGGYKEVIAKISGDGVFGQLKFELVVTVFSVYPKPSLKAAFTLPPVPLL